MSTAKSLFLFWMVLFAISMPCAAECTVSPGPQASFDFSTAPSLDSATYDTLPVGAELATLSITNGFDHSYVFDRTACTPGSKVTGGATNFTYHSIESSITNNLKIRLELTDASGAEISSSFAPGTFAVNNTSIYAKAILIKNSSLPYAQVYSAVNSLYIPNGPYPYIPVSFPTRFLAGLEGFYIGEDKLFGPEFDRISFMSLNKVISKPKVSCTLTSSLSTVNLGTISTLDIINGSASSQPFQINMTCTGGSASIASITASDVNSVSNQLNISSGHLSAVDTTTKQIDSEVDFKYDLTSSVAPTKSDDFPMVYNITLTNKIANITPRDISGAMKFTVEYN